MNKELSEYILLNIGQPSYIDRWSGVVQTLTKEEKKFAAGHILIGSECSRNEDIAEIIPDSQYKGILYFEDRGLVPTRNLSSAYGWRSDLRIVCWLNGEKMEPALPGHSLSTFAVNDLVKRLSRIFPNSGVFNVVRAVVTGIAIQDGNIFSRYDYDDSTSGYLQCPFEYFAIDIAVNFFITKNCSFNFSPSLNNC